MNAHWTVQDVERFREQQRWRLRHKTHTTRQRSPPADNQQQEASERPRKVSLKFRREHDQFVAKQQTQAPLSPHAHALAVTMRPAFAVVVPHSTGPRTADSPLPHTAYSLFNAFDSTASPEAFALECTSNQDDSWRALSTDEDQEMASDGEDQHSDDHGHLQLGSLWRRRFLVQGMGKRSPKLGRAALWEDATNGNIRGACSNQRQELIREPLPFADDNADDL